MKIHFNKKNKCSGLTDSIKNDIIHKCNYCNRKYKKTKKEHEDICSVKKMEEKLEEIKEEIKELKENKNVQIINNNTNNNTNNTNNINNKIEITNNNNISLNSYMNYSTNHITIEKIIKFIEDRDMSEFFPFMFEIIFYNPNCPENQSIFYVDDKCIYVNQGSFNFKKITIEEFNKFTNDKLYKTCIRMLSNVPHNKLCDNDVEIVKNYIENKDSNISEQHQNDIKDIMIYGNNDTIDVYSKLLENPDKYILPARLSKNIKSIMLQNE